MRSVCARGRRSGATAAAPITELLRHHGLVVAPHNVGAPLFVVRGSADFLVDGLRTDDMHERLRAVIHLALEPGLRGLRECGGVQVIRPRKTDSHHVGGAAGPRIA